MKRSGFSKAPPPRAARAPLVLATEPTRAVLRRADGNARLTVAVPKGQYVRSEAYRRLVAALPCAHCKRAGPSQAAHADEGKGLSLKADDRTCYPLCADSPGRRGCHSLLGASGAFTREHRRTLEAKYQRETWATLDAAGLIPKGMVKL